MIQKNEEIIVDILSQGYEGEGVAKIENNFPVFIEGALRGEKIKIKIIKVKKTYAYGKIIEIIEKSEERVNSVCDIYSRCGGCKTQHMTYKEQLNFKRDRVKDCINKIAGLNVEIVKPTIGMNNPHRYRNKVQLPIGLKNGKLQIGFFAERSHEIINMKSCNIQDKIADKVVELTRKWIVDYNIRPYNIDGQYDEKGIARHIMIRRGFKTGEVMVVLVTNGDKLPYKEEFIHLIKNNIEGITSIIQNVNNEKTNVILGNKSITLWGKETISDYIGDFKFNISPLSFFQVNPIQTEVLYSKVLEYADLTGQEDVFDAYCGTGTITLFLSQKAKKVYGVEIIPQAIENAIENAKINDVNNAEFFVGEAEKVIPNLISKGVKSDVVVVDPPRKGCDRKLLEAISSINAKTIVYVSCDPSTLARDLGVLEELGYQTIKVQPVDMFPHTAHIENVVKLIKK